MTTTPDERLLASILLWREEITWEWGKGKVEEIETWIFRNIREFFTERRFWAETEGWNEELNDPCDFCYDEATNGKLYSSQREQWAC